MLQILGIALSLIFSFSLISIARESKITGKVVGVTDGDTITILDKDNQQHKIRLDGIDAPELGQPFGQAAKQSLSDKVFTRNVTVHSKKTDRGGRLVGEVLYFDQTGTIQGASSQQLTSGMAWFYKEYASELAFDLAKEYEVLENYARLSKTGLWADKSPIAPWDYRKGGSKATQKPKPTQEVDEKIIGNKNSMIYHWPGCPSYHRIAERNKIYFRTRAEAEKAGYRAARNC